MSKRFVRITDEDWVKITVNSIDHILLRDDHSRMLVFLKTGNIIDIKINNMHQYVGHYLDDVDQGIEP